MPGKYESKTVLLTTLSPVHIGAGQLGRNHQQGFITVKDKDYLIDTQKLQALLFETKGLAAVEKFIGQMEGGRLKIENLLKDYNLFSENAVKKIAKGVLPARKGTDFPKSGDHYYIPGSSIKGSIRTAVLFHMLRERLKNNQLKTFVKNEIKKLEKSRDRKKTRESFAKKLVIEHIQKYMPVESIANPDRRPESEGSFKDVFRAVKIKDAMIEEPHLTPDRFGEITDFDPDNKRVIVTTLSRRKVFVPADPGPEKIKLQKGEYIKILQTEYSNDVTIIKRAAPGHKSFRNNRIKKYPAMLCSLRHNKVQHKHTFHDKYETFQGSAFFDVSLDLELMEQFNQNQAYILPFHDVDSLLQLCKTFAAEIWTEEQNYLAEDNGGGDVDLNAIDSFYTKYKGKASLRLGWGSGMLATTVSLLLDEPDRKELRDKAVPATPGTWPLPAPKSRRLLFDKDENNPILPFGWVQLEETGND